MITSLSIENFALIEKLSIDFSSGFSTITGETGAGKSILLGALGLVLGKRADLTSLKNKNEKCIIEAHFQISNYNLYSFFSSNDLDYEEETIIRREILPSGKSRAFINDTPVNLQELQDLSLFLIDIHSQHQTQELSEEDFQFQIIDSIANNQDLISKYDSQLKLYKKQKSDLSQLNLQIQNALNEQDYNTFLLKELVEADLANCDQSELEATLEKLSNVESIKENLVKAELLANEEQFGVLHNLKEMRVAVQKASGFSATYHSLFERLNSVLIELDDISRDLKNESENLINDPELLENVNHKLQLIYSLQKKHQVLTLDELLVIQNELDRKVISIADVEAQIQFLEKSIKENEFQLNQLAQEIHENRAKVIPILVEQVN
jgi:DNA repair protein RecN (Recombination protein N)